MVSHLRRIWCSRARCIAFVACGLIVLCYAPDVFDFNSPNFPVLLSPVQTSVIVAELPSDIDLILSHKQAESLGDIALLSAEKLGNYIRLQRVRRPESTLLDSVRSHGYRVGLARVSVPVPSSYD